MCRHGASAVIVGPGAPGGDIALHLPWNGEGRADAFADLRDRLDGDGHDFRRFVLSEHHGGEAPDLGGALCLMLIQAHHEGLREGYGRLKKLAESGPPALLGVIVCEAASLKSARYHYRKLATAAQRFLGLRAASYGALPPAPPAWGDEIPRPADREARISHLARLLIQDWQAHQQSLNEERTPT